MIKKEKPMLSVAALIEAQNRWVHQRIYHHETFAGLHIKINFTEKMIEKKYLKKLFLRIRLTHVNLFLNEKEIDGTNSSKNCFSSAPLISGIMGNCGGFFFG